MRRDFVIATAMLLLTSLLATQASTQTDPAIENLPACEKLNALQRQGESLPQYIADAGFEEFARPILTTCPGYLVDLGSAWELYARQNAAAFERLSPCEKLNIKREEGADVADFIQRSGYAIFAESVLEDCPGHLIPLGQAWLNENPNPFKRGEDDPFARQPACQQLVQIQAKGQSLVDYILISGIEQYEADIRSTCREYLPFLEDAKRKQNGSQSIMLNFGANRPAAPAPSKVHVLFESLAPRPKLETPALPT